MSRTDLDPELRRLGEALRAATTIDLARDSEERRTRSDAAAPAPRSWRTRLHPRAVAGTSLGLAAVAAALLLAFGGGGGTAPSTAKAVTVTRQADGSILVSINTNATVYGQAANEKLAAMGLDESVYFAFVPGPAPVSGPVACTPMTGEDAPVGPPVRALLDADGTADIPAGQTGAGLEHLTCSTSNNPRFASSGDSSGSGNSGSDPIRQPRSAVGRCAGQRGARLS